jgi:hypothetical protein
VKEPADGWSDEERAIVRAFEDELGVLRDRYARHPPLALLRAARAGVLEGELQSIADRYLEANPWARALVGDPEPVVASAEEDIQELPGRAAAGPLTTIDVEPERTRPPRRLEPVAGVFHVSWSWKLATAGAMAAIVVAVLVWRGDRARDGAPSPQVANDGLAPPPVAGGAPAVVDRIEDGSRVITIARDGTVSGVDDVPPALEGALVRAIATGRLETEPGVDEIVGKQGTLLGPSAAPAQVALASPVGISVESRRPSFRWNSVDGGRYQVSVFDQAYNPIVESGWLAATEWSPPRALEGGKQYSWQIRVRTGGREIIVPSRPAPEARFRVLNDAAVQLLSQLRERHAQAHLVLGVAYTRLGLFDAAERELAAAVTRNPSSVRARQLAADLDRLRGK